MNQQDQIYIDSIQEQINSGMYDHLFREPVGMDDYVPSIPKSNLVFLDIGANIGLVSRFAAEFCKRIVAIEPDPITFKELVSMTKGYGKIECIQSALTPKNGPHEFFVNDINFTASSTVNTYGKQIMVEGKTLGTFLVENNLQHVDVCKIDAEGAEGEALNLEQLQQATPIIDCWFIEFHNCPLTTWEHKLGTAVGNFARCGYSNMKVKGMSLTVRR
jgi:FkbM family methyltransferase